MTGRSSNILRAFSTKQKTYFVTTPIYYVNANPHIGHLYSSVIADATQRWQNLFKKSGAEIKFSTGTDEHGTKIQQAAAKSNASIADYCSTISSKYKDLASTFSINYSDFVRTTDENHKKVVQTFWKSLRQNGHIYSSTYEGWYCVSDETFLSNSQLKEIVHPKNGEKILVSAESGHPVEWTSEQNYLFKLSSFQKDLKHWLISNEKRVQPQKFYKILLDMIDGEIMHDVSISRPSSRVHWGIPVPHDDTQSVYVWLDALVNYLTVAGYGAEHKNNFKNVWPPDVQVIGKDILKFHGVYWPAFLLGAGLEPPHSLLCHSHWTVNGEKMSKSKGNVVCPFERSSLYTSDGLRYFLLREGVSHSDGNYSDTKVMRILNSELADTLGNLLSRCCGSALNPNQAVPAIDSATFHSLTTTHDVTNKLIEHLKALPDTCEEHYASFNFYKVVDAVIATLHVGNLFFETLKPWELKKSAQKQNELNAVLHVTMETLRIAAVLLQPIIPNISEALLNKLSVPERERCFESLNNFSWNNPGFQKRSLSNDKSVLFKRIVLETKDSRKSAAKK